MRVCHANLLSSSPIIPSELFIYCLGSRIHSKVSSNDTMSHKDLIGDGNENDSGNREVSVAIALLKCFFKVHCVT